MAVFPRSEGSTGNGRRRLGRRTRWLVCVLAPLVVLPLAMLVLPVPGLDGYLTRMATERVTSWLACPASLRRRLGSGSPVAACYRSCCAAGCPGSSCRYRT